MAEPWCIRKTCCLQLWTCSRYVFALRPLKQPADVYKSIDALYSKALGVWGVDSIVAGLHA